MKKWILALLVVVVISLFTLPFLLIPSDLKISSIVKTERNTAGAFRSLSKTGDWSKWWPGRNDKNMPFCTVFTECKFIFNGYRYLISDTLLYNALVITVSKENQNYDSRIYLIPLNTDSTYLHWTCTMPTGSNPFTRIKRYREAVQLKISMDSILMHMKKFLDKTENVYGSEINHTMSGDSTLVVIQYQTKSYPTTEEVYSRIQKLKNYLISHQAKENNYPMMLIRKNDHGAYDNTVGIPTNKALEDSGEIIRQRYVPYKILLVEVKGGDSAISRARSGLNDYIKDNQLQVMARPYESLVTNRSLEKDSSKWITRLICAIP